MGAGKSSVGRVVAEQLGFKFVDTDQMIETTVGRTISEIFAQDGEAHFRTLERKIVEQLQDVDRHVISTGGGLPTQQANIDSLKTHALVFCLWCSAETIWERVRHQGHRPLLQSPDPEAKMRELLESRVPFYRQADVLLNTNNRSMRQVAEQVVQQFRLATARRK